MVVQVLDFNCTVDDDKRLVHHGIPYTCISSAHSPISTSIRPVGLNKAPFNILHTSASNQGKHNENNIKPAIVRGFQEMYVLITGLVKKICEKVSTTVFLARNLSRTLSYREKEYGIERLAASDRGPEMRGWAECDK